MGGSNVSKEEKELLNRIKTEKKARTGTLDAKGLELANLNPKIFKDITAVAEINFANNRLASLPAEISILTNLKVVTLRFENFSFFLSLSLSHHSKIPSHAVYINSFRIAFFVSKKNQCNDSKKSKKQWQSS